MKKLIGQWKSEFWKHYIDNDDENGGDSLELWHSCNNDKCREDLLNSLIIHGYYDSCNSIFSEIFFEQDLRVELEYKLENGDSYGVTSVRFGNTEYTLDILNRDNLEIELISVDWVIEKEGKRKPKKQVWKKILKNLSSNIKYLSEHKSILGNEVIDSLENKLKEFESYENENQIPDCIYDFEEGKPKIETIYLDASKYGIDGKPYEMIKKNNI